MKGDLRPLRNDPIKYMLLSKAVQSTDVSVNYWALYETLVFSHEEIIESDVYSDYEFTILSWT